MLGFLDTSTGIDLESPVNWSASLNQSRLAWWLALPGIGWGSKFVDLTGSTNLPALTSTYAWSTSIRGGSFGSTAISDAIGKGFGMTAPARLQIGIPFTISAWVRTLGAITANTEICGMTYDNAGNSPWVTYAFRFNSSSNLGAGWNSAGTMYTFDSTTPAGGPSGWWHLAFSVTASRQVFYIDGVQADLGTSTRSNPNYSATSILYIGSRTASDASRNTQIDDFSVWTRAFSASEVVALRAEALAGYPQTLRRMNTRTIVSLSPPVSAPIFLMHRSSSGMPSADSLE